MYLTHFLSMVKAVLGLAPFTATAGGTGDNTAQNGVTIDRQDVYSAVVAVPVKAVLADAKTATVSVKVQHSADGSSWADFQSTTNLVLTGGTGGSTETGLVEMKVNLQAAKRYIRTVVTCDLSNTITDTATFSATVVKMGAVKNPQ